MKKNQGLFQLKQNNSDNELHHYLDIEEHFEGIGIAIGIIIAGKFRRF